MSGRVFCEGALPFAAVRVSLFVWFDHLFVCVYCNTTAQQFDDLFAPAATSHCREA